MSDSGPVLRGACDCALDHSIRRTMSIGRPCRMLYDARPTMAHDPIQIALEHHRAGRLQRAEAGYRNVLDTDPGNPQAMHWVGVLAYQAGRPEEAVFWLEQAAAIRATDAGYQHNLAQAYVARGESDAAIRTFEKALALEPARGESWAGLGLAYLKRPTDDDAKAAVAALLQAEAIGPVTAVLQHHLGVALLRAGQAEVAIAPLRLAVEKDPALLPPYHHLGLALRAAGKGDEARQVLTEATRRDAGFAPAWNGLAVLEGEAGRFDEAAALFQRAVALRPDYAAAWHGLGHVLHQAGKKREAVDTFRQALLASRRARQTTPLPSVVSGAPSRSLSASVAELERRIGQESGGTDLHYALATMTGIFSPGRVPQWAVAGLFDNYADTFDAHLRGQLEYRVPEMIAQTVAAIIDPEHPPDVLDLGCGTGLCGLLLRPLVATLAGVDLSANMVEKSRARNVYDRLEVGDLVGAIQARRQSLDLLTAADVFVYVGDLVPAFEAAREALRPGGRLVFSVEAGPGDRFVLGRHSRRYAHAKAYVLHMADICGFKVESFEEITVRLECAKPVPGYLVMLQNR